MTRRPGPPARRVLPLPIVAALAAAVLGVARPAGAELVFFATGRTLSVTSHRLEGDRVVLSLRGGGEMTVDAALVGRIGPDEAPYPEPAVVPPPDTTPSAPASAGRIARHPLYDPLIQEAAQRHGVDPSLVRAVVQVESAYEPRARSRKGAVGLMQVMPATARRYGVRNLADPATNLNVGIRHLKTLLDRFPLALALAAYNAGETAVERFRGVPPYPETVAYVARVRALLRP